jgi:hypothetical protein
MCIVINWMVRHLFAENMRLCIVFCSYHHAVCHAVLCWVVLCHTELGQSPGSAEGHHWMLDPIDGTRGFISCKCMLAHRAVQSLPCHTGCAMPCCAVLCCAVWCCVTQIWARVLVVQRAGTGCWTPLMAPVAL